MPFPCRPCRLPECGTYRGTQMYPRQRSRCVLLWSSTVGIANFIYTYIFISIYIYLVIVTYVYLLIYPYWYHVLLNDITCDVVKTWCVLPQKEWESSHSQCKETPMMVEWPYPIYVPSFDHGTHVMTCYCCWLVQHDGHRNPFPLFRFVPPYLK